MRILAWLLVLLAAAVSSQQPQLVQAGSLSPAAPSSPGIHQRARKQAPQPTGPLPARDFLKVRGLELWRGKYEFSNIGINIPDLLSRFLEGNGNTAITDMQRAAKSGIRFIRCDGGARTAAEFSKFDSDRSGWLAAYQHMLAAADALGLSIVPILLPDIKLFPQIAPPISGSAQYSVGQYLTRDTAPNRIAVRYVDAIVSSFKNDPRVLFWEIGEEYNRDADMPVSATRTVNDYYTSDQLRSFLEEMASLIKGIDRNHLVSSGNGDMRPNSWHLRQAMIENKATQHQRDYEVDSVPDRFSEYSEMLSLLTPAEIDLVSIHQSPPVAEQVSWLVEDDEHAYRLPWSQLAAASVPAARSGAPAGKPIFVGEFGQPSPVAGKASPLAWTLDFIRRVRSGPATLCALNNWETAGSELRSASTGQAAELVSQLLAANQGLLLADLAAPDNR